MKIAVSGGTGFVGAHLIKKLKQQGHEVLSLDRKHGYDLTNKEMISNISFVDLFVLLAAKNFVPESYVIPQEFYVFNFLSTLNLLEVAKRHGARVIYFSSYLYGNPKYLPIDEKHPISPHNPYAQSKLICEELCRGYARDFNVPTTIFRPFNIYGPNQNENYLIPKIIKNIQTGKVLLNDPEPRRDLIYIDDVVDAVLASIHLPNQGLEVFNLGYGKSISIVEIAETIKKIFKAEVSIQFTNEKRKDEVMDTQCDNSKLMQALNWKPLYSFEEGIRSMKNRVELH